MSAEDVRQSRSPLRRLGWVVLAAALLSLLLLPLPMLWPVSPLAISSALV